MTDEPKYSLSLDRSVEQARLPLKGFGIVTRFQMNLCVNGVDVMSVTGNDVNVTYSAPGPEAIEQMMKDANEAASLRATLAEVRRVQQEWWDGDVPMNVALSEIRQIVQT